jgi:hypothetical protein
MSHTPGPWEADLEYGGCLVRYSPGPEQDYQIVADCSGLGKRTPEQAANVRLIAAAPDLLKYLRAWVESTNSHEQNGTMEPVYRGALALIRAVDA